MTQAALPLFGPSLTAKDREDLRTQQQRVVTLMLGGGWFTIAEVARAIGASESGAGARMRTCRQLGLVLERKRSAPGSRLYLYRLTGGAA